MFFLIVGSGEQSGSCEEDACTVDSNGIRNGARGKKRAYVVFTEGRRGAWTKEFSHRLETNAPGIMSQVSLNRVCFI